MPDAAPHQTVLDATIPAAGAAVVQDNVIGTAPYAGTVSAVTIVPEAALTANATTYRTFRVVNKGTAGAGTTVVATFATDTVTVDNLVAHDEKTIPLSAVGGATTVAEGDVLVADETVASTGVAHSGYAIKVTVDRS